MALRVLLIRRAEMVSNPAVERDSNLPPRFALRLSLTSKLKVDLAASGRKPDLQNCQLDRRLRLRSDLITDYIE